MCIIICELPCLSFCYACLLQYNSITMHWYHFKISHTIAGIWNISTKSAHRQHKRLKKTYGIIIEKVPVGFCQIPSFPCMVDYYSVQWSVKPLNCNWNSAVQCLPTDCKTIHFKLTFNCKDLASIYEDFLHKLRI